jgi:DNA-binding IclR family transcriptional regulator
MVARAIHITETLQKEDGFLSVDELLMVTGYSRTTIYRILRTLASFGYVHREVRSGRYGWCANTRRHNQREKKEPYSLW